MNLFIDTNIYLSYFETSKETIKSLDELEKLLAKKKVRILLPEQVRNEFSIRKNTKVREMRKILKEKEREISFSLPPIARGWKESEKLVENIRSIKKSFKSFYKKYEKTVIGEDSQVDKKIEKIFKKAINVPNSEKIFKKAFYRVLSGRPPGKNKEYKDAIIWEAILGKKPKGKLIIISNDDDWYADEASNAINNFLIKEWSKINKEAIEGYRSLGQFIGKITKSKKITKKIIKEEESVSRRLADIENLSTLNISQTTSSGTISSSLYGQSLSTTSDPTVVSGSWGTTSSFDISAKPCKFCPFCGKEIKEIPTDYHSLYVTTGYDDSITCPHCHKSFSVTGQ